VPLLARPAVPLEDTASKLAVAPEYVTVFTPQCTKGYPTIRNCNVQKFRAEGRFGNGETAFGQALAITGRVFADRVK
jgi:hypothetical protein